jgi:hypothetical protein
MTGIVQRSYQPVGGCGEDGAGFNGLPLRGFPEIPEASKAHGRAVLEVDIERDFSIIFLPPLEKA